jgi:hypothetical protein
MSSSILTSTWKLLSLHKSLWEDPLGLLQMADEEALLVHVVAIVRLYVVLDDFLLQDSKIAPIRMF